jgi:thiamine-phosphate pyrophosphorylase
MLRYAITSRALYPGEERERQAALVCEAARWANEDIDFIQLREKDLPPAEIATLAREILRVIALAASATKLLISSQPSIAMATGAHGVHLTTAPDELAPDQVRNLYAFANLSAPIITVSCHTLEEVERAHKSEVDAILFAPVFEKMISGQIITPGQGLDKLRAACTIAAPVPMYALGGVTLQNADSCLDAGASGIAGIRLFHNPG